MTSERVWRSGGVVGCGGAQASGRVRDAATETETGRYVRATSPGHDVVGLCGVLCCAAVVAPACPLAKQRRIGRLNTTVVLVLLGISAGLAASCGLRPWSYFPLDVELSLVLGDIARGDRCSVPDGGILTGRLANPAAKAAPNFDTCCDDDSSDRARATTFS